MLLEQSDTSKKHEFQTDKALAASQRRDGHRMVTGSMLPVVVEGTTTTTKKLACFGLWNMS